MNIFAMDVEPYRSALWHTDRMLRLMIKETAQLLSTAHRVLDGHRHSSRFDELGMYKIYAPKHPCSTWVQSSRGNYEWLAAFFWHAGEEYRYRFSKEHASFEKLSEVLQIPPSCVPDGRLTPHPLVMPDECVVGNDPYASYRKYVRMRKGNGATWSKRNRPWWWDKMV